MSMTIDEAIAYALEEAGEYQERADSAELIDILGGLDVESCKECAADHRQLAEWLTEYKDLKAEQNDQYVFIHELMSELKEAKELLKLTIDTNYSLHKSCYNCSHFTSDCNCDIGKYLYGTGEKECEWEWKHMGEIRNFLHD